MPLFLIIFMLFPLSINAEDLPPLASKAEKLYDIGDYDNSIELFDECYNDSHNPVCISQPLTLLEKAYLTLPKISRHSLIRFTPSKSETSWKDFFTKQLFENILPHSIMDLAFGSPGLMSLPIEGYIGVYDLMKDTSSPGAPIQIANPETVKSITSSITFFKTWVQRLSSLSRNCYARDDQDVCLNYMNKLKDLRKSLDAYYRDFFSYEVASPILAKTQQLIFIADTSKTFGVDENVLRDAARFLGTLNDEVFMHVNQDVRNQFLDVYRELKDKAGKEQIEEIKVIQTMQDKFLNNRYSEPMF